MNTSDSTSPVRPRWRDVASREQVGMLGVAWGIGAAFVITSTLLIIGAFQADPTAGESWQPAGMLGAIGLSFGATIVIVGMLTRIIVMKSGRR
ncbi:hypothetical protein P8605_30745 [Streptomyces sp. T-3]|nr:hypothetical protein [Streptomyces sp. T-3]